MKVVAYDRYADKEAMREKGIELRSLEEVFKVADFVSMHLPLTNETQGHAKRGSLQVDETLCVLHKIPAGAVFMKTKCWRKC